MKMIKHIALMLSLMLMSALVIPAQAAPLSYSLGDTVQDFTFTTYDGKEFRFSDILKEKEAVLINIWASWCGPCRSEFPYMQQAYEKYKDQVEVIALSSEPTDTSDVLADFAKQYGLTFLIGQDPVDFLSALQIGSIPTTLMVDRFGTICLIETGAQPSVESFERMFDAFLGDTYTESVLYRELPSAKPDVPAAAEADLTAALEIPASNSGGAYTWPMLPAEEDGRKVLVSSNSGKASSEAAVSAVVDAQKGNAIVVTFKTSTEQIFDALTITVNGKKVKSFTGDHDWTSYAIPVDADDEYTVQLAYTKDQQGDAGEDMVWIDSIRVDDDAENALLANPVYPANVEQLVLTASDESVREITIEDASGLLRETFGDARYFITNADQATVTAQLTSAHDPETSFFYTSKGAIHPLMDCIQTDSYTLQVAVDSADTTGYACTSVLLYTDNTGAEYISALLFRDEENVELLCEYNGLGEWTYADASKEQPDLALLSDQVNYVVTCTDQNGNPVAGVMVQVCDEATCQVFFSDESGQCTFAAAPKAWEIHILMAPEGYSAGENTIVHAPVEGGNVDLTLTKQ